MGYTWRGVETSTRTGEADQGVTGNAYTLILGIWEWKIMFPVHCEEVVSMFGAEEGSHVLNGVCVCVHPCV